MLPPPARICPDTPVDFAEDLKDRVTVPLGGLDGAAPVAGTPAAGVAGAAAAVAGAGAPAAKSAL